MLTITATCVKCDVDAPGVGYGGFLGTPSLATTIKRGADPEEYPFGYLYEPLRGIGLRPRDLEEMQAFLAAHEGHPVVAWSEAQDESTLPPKLVALLARRERARRRSRRQSVDSVVCVAGQVDPDWALGHYAVRCTTCDAEHACEVLETIRRFDCLPLSRDAVDLMLKRWGKLAPDDGWNHALRPAVDPYGEFIEGLLAFLEKHRRHEIEARLRAVD
jgi:hypothetical protein